MSNYAELLEQANAIQAMAQGSVANRMYHASHFLAAAATVRDLAEALVTVSNQNRNLRADLELTKRDYEANLEELLRVSESTVQTEDQNRDLRTLVAMLAECKSIKVQLVVSPDEEHENICVDREDGLRYIVDPRLKEPVVGVYDPELAEVLE